MLEAKYFLAQGMRCLDSHIAMECASASAFETPKKKRPLECASDADCDTPKSLVELREENDFAKQKESRKRQRTQVGRNLGDQAKLHAIKVHFNTPSEDFIYGVIREGRSLWQRVSDDWDEKEKRCLTKFNQGYWPMIKSLYGSEPRDTNTPALKAPGVILDKKWAEAKASYNPAKGRRKTGELLTWIDTVTKVTPSTFEDLVHFIKGLNPNTVKLDREIILKVMDLIQRLDLRTPDYLENFMDVKDVFDHAMIHQYCVARRDHHSLRKFVEMEAHRLELLCELERCWAILDEKEDLSKRLPDLLVVSNQSATVAKFFEKDKNRIMLAYLNSFVQGQIDGWKNNNTPVTRRILDNTIEACMAEASNIGCD